MKGGKRSKPSLQKRDRPSPAKGNPRLAAQNRKLLGQHYANKYGIRKG